MYTYKHHKTVSFTNKSVSISYTIERFNSIMIKNTTKFQVLRVSWKLLSNL